MTSINLLQEDQQQNSAEKKIVLSNIGFFLPMAILVVVILGFGGLKLYNATLVSKDNNLKAQFKQESESIVWSDVDKVADFQTRLKKIGLLLPAQDFYGNLFAQLEKSTITNANIETLSSGQDGLTIQYNADNFLTVARQILSDKKAEQILNGETTNYFSNVRVNSINRDPQTGRILFTIGMSAKGK